MFWKKKGKNESNSDFEEFKKEISWFVKSSDLILFEEEVDNFYLSETFKQIFPKLHSLISKARIICLKINDRNYRLYSWTSNKNQSCGWLTEIEEKRNNKINMCLEHEILLEEIGGIRESYNQPENSLCNNQNFIFIGAECNLGIGEYDEYYQMMCEDKKCEKISDENLISFAQEANGALTLYDKETKQVYLFSHDHSFDNVEFIKTQPKYTYHKFKEINHFIDYVETLSLEWLNEIKEGSREQSI